MPVRVSRTCMHIRLVLLLGDVADAVYRSKKVRSCDARKHDALLVPWVFPNLNVPESETGRATEDMFDCVCLVVTDFECDGGVVGEDAFAGEKGSDGAVKGETVLDWCVGVVADECMGVFVVFDR